MIATTGGRDTGQEASNRQQWLTRSPEWGRRTTAAPRTVPGVTRVKAGRARDATRHTAQAEAGAPLPVFLLCDAHTKR